MEMLVSLSFFGGSNFVHVSMTSFLQRCFLGGFKSKRRSSEPVTFYCLFWTPHLFTVE